MEISEIIGLLISLGAFLFLFLRPIWLAFYQKKHPEEYAKAKQEKDRQMKTLLKTLDIQVDDDEDEEEDEDEWDEEFEEKEEERLKSFREKSLATRTLGYQYKGAQIGVGPKLFVTPKPTEQKLIKSSSNAYAIQFRSRKARGVKVLKQLRSPKDMIIIQAIIGPPKCDGLK